MLGLAVTSISTRWVPTWSSNGSELLAIVLWKAKLMVLSAGVALASGLLVPTRPDLPERSISGRMDLVSDQGLVSVPRPGNRS